MSTEVLSTVLVWGESEGVPLSLLWGLRLTRKELREKEKKGLILLACGCVYVTDCSNLTCLYGYLMKLCGRERQTSWLQLYLQEHARSFVYILSFLFFPQVLSMCIYVCLCLRSADSSTASTNPLFVWMDVPSGSDEGGIKSECQPTVDRFHPACPLSHVQEREKLDNEWNKNMPLFSLVRVMDRTQIIRCELSTVDLWVRETF